jgi:hypothetical protein
MSKSRLFVQWWLTSKERQSRKNRPVVADARSILGWHQLSEHKRRLPNQIEPSPMESH